MHSLLQLQGARVNQFQCPRDGGNMDPAHSSLAQQFCSGHLTATGSSVENVWGPLNTHFVLRAHHNARVVYGLLWHPAAVQTHCYAFAGVTEPRLGIGVGDGHHACGAQRSVNDNVLHPNANSCGELWKGIESACGLV